MKPTVVHRTALRGVVSAVPGEAIAVSSLEVPFSREEVAKMQKSVGLGTVYRAPRGQTATDLCVAAARRLLDDLGWAPESVDGLIVVTQTPDHFLPASACVAHGALGLGSHAFAFDIGMGCSGYVYGLWAASQFVAGGARRVLLLAGDTISHLLSPEDRSVALLFGDAGSATALEHDEAAEPMAFVVGTDGTGARDLCVPAGGFRQRGDASSCERVTDDAGNRRAATELYMDGLSIFNFTLQRVPPLVEATLAARGWTREAVDAFAFHQANGFILKTIGKKLGLDGARVPTNIERYGNTSLASIPLLLSDDLAERLRADAPTQLVLAGFGVGFSWAGAALTTRALGSAGVVRVDA